MDAVTAAWIIRFLGNAGLSYAAVALYLIPWRRATKRTIVRCLAFSSPLAFVAIPNLLPELLIQLCSDLAGAMFDALTYVRHLRRLTWKAVRYRLAYIPGLCYLRTTSAFLGFFPTVLKVWQSGARNAFCTRRGNVIHVLDTWKQGSFPLSEYVKRFPTALCGMDSCFLPENVTPGDRRECTCTMKFDLPEWREAERHWTHRDGVSTWTGGPFQDWQLEDDYLLTHWSTQLVEARRYAPIRKNRDFVHAAAMTRRLLARGIVGPSLSIHASRRTISELNRRIDALVAVGSDYHQDGERRGPCEPGNCYYSDDDDYSDDRGQDSLHYDAFLEADDFHGEGDRVEVPDSLLAFSFPRRDCTGYVVKPPVSRTEYFAPDDENDFHVRFEILICTNVVTIILRDEQAGVPDWIREYQEGNPTSFIVLVTEQDAIWFESVDQPPDRTVTVRDECYCWLRGLCGSTAPGYMPELLAARDWSADDEYFGIDHVVPGWFIAPQMIILDEVCCYAHLEDVFSGWCYTLFDWPPRLHFTLARFHEKPEGASVCTWCVVGYVVVKTKKVPVIHIISAGRVPDEVWNEWVITEALIGAKSSEKDAVSPSIEWCKDIGVDVELNVAYNTRVTYVPQLVGVGILLSLYRFTEIGSSLPAYFGIRAAYLFGEHGFGKCYMAFCPVDLGRFPSWETIYQHEASWLEGTWTVTWSIWWHVSKGGEFTTSDLRYLAKKRRKGRVGLDPVVYHVVMTLLVSYMWMELPLAKSHVLRSLLTAATAGIAVSYVFGLAYAFFLRGTNGYCYLDAIPWYLRHSFGPWPHLAAIQPYLSKTLCVEVNSIPGAYHFSHSDICDSLEDLNPTWRVGGLLGEFMSILDAQQASPGTVPWRKREHETTLLNVPILFAIWATVASICFVFFMRELRAYEWMCFSIAVVNSYRTRARGRLVLLLRPFGTTGDFVPLRAWKAWLTKQGYRVLWAPCAPLSEGEKALAHLEAGQAYLGASIQREALKNSAKCRNVIQYVPYQCASQGCTVVYDLSAPLYQREVAKILPTSSPAFIVYNHLREFIRLVRMPMTIGPFVNGAPRLDILPRVLPRQNKIFVTAGSSRLSPSRAFLDTHLKGLTGKWVVQTDNETLYELLKIYHRGRVRVRLVPKGDHRVLFSGAATVLCHGGIGTMCTAIANGASAHAWSEAYDREWKPAVQYHNSPWRFLRASIPYMNCTQFLQHLCCMSSSTERAIDAIAFHCFLFIQSLFSQGFGVVLTLRIFMIPKVWFTADFLSRGDVMRTGILLLLFCTVTAVDVFTAVPRRRFTVLFESMAGTCVYTSTFLTTQGLALCYLFGFSGLIVSRVLHSCLLYLTSLLSSIMVWFTSTMNFTAEMEGRISLRVEAMDMRWWFGPAWHVYLCDGRTTVEITTKNEKGLKCVSVISVPVDPNRALQTVFSLPTGLESSAMPKLLELLKAYDGTIYHSFNNCQTTTLWTLLRSVFETLDMTPRGMPLMVLACSALCVVYIAGLLFTLVVVSVCLLSWPFVHFAIIRAEDTFLLLTVLFAFGERMEACDAKEWLLAVKANVEQWIPRTFVSATRNFADHILGPVATATVAIARGAHHEAVCFHSRVAICKQARKPDDVLSAFQTMGRIKTSWGPDADPLISKRRDPLSGVVLAEYPKFELTTYEATLREQVRSANAAVRHNHLHLRGLREQLIKHKLVAPKYIGIVDDWYVREGIDGQAFACRETMGASLKPYTEARVKSPVTPERMDEIARTIVENAPQRFRNASLMDPSFGYNQFMKHPKYAAGLDLMMCGVEKRSDIRRLKLGRRLMCAGLSPLITGRWRPALMHAKPKSQIVDREKLRKRPDKLRSITATTLINNISQLCLFGDLNKRMDWRGMAKNGIPLNGACIGKIFEAHAKYDEHFSLDATAMDRTVGEAGMEIVARVRKLCFKDHPLYDTIARHIDCALEQTRRAYIVNLVGTRMFELEGLISEQDKATWMDVDPDVKAEICEIADEILNFNTYAPNGYVIKVGGGATGDANVTFNNCVVCEAYIIDCVCRSAGIPPSDFCKHFLLSNMSDDNMLSSRGLKIDIPMVQKLCKELYGMTIRVESKGADILSQQFLAKIPCEGKLLSAEFARFNIPVPQFAVIHDPERLRRSIAQHKIADGGKLKGSRDKVLRYQVVRLSGHMANCAHQEELYQALHDQAHQYLLEMSKRNRKGLVIPSYEKIFRDWYSDKRLADFLRVQQLKINSSFSGRLEVGLTSFIDTANDVLRASNLADLSAIIEPITPTKLESSGFYEEFVFWRFAYRFSRAPSQIEFSNACRLSAFANLTAPTMWYERLSERFKDSHVRTEANIQTWKMVWLTIVYCTVTNSIGVVARMPGGHLLLRAVNLVRYDMPLLFGSLSHLAYVIRGEVRADVGKFMPKDKNYYLKYAATLVSDQFPVHKIFAYIDVLYLMEICDRTLTAVLSVGQPVLGSAILIDDLADASIWAQKVDEVIECQTKAPIVTVSAPCGTGKTRFFPDLLQRRSGKVVYLILPRRVLCAAYIARNPQAVWRRAGVPEKAPIMVMTYGYLATLMEEAPADLSDVLLVFDEAHEPSAHWQILIQEYLPAWKAVLLTATPLAWMKKYPHFDVPVEPLHKVVDVPAMTSTMVEEFNARVSTCQRILLIEPSAKACEHIASTLRAQGHDVKVLSSKQPIVPEIGHVVATSIADASLTLPGCDCVIDSGYSLVNEDGSLRRVPYDMATKIQRKGRTGRTCPGIYISFCAPLDVFRKPAPGIEDLLEDNYVAKHYKNFIVSLDRYDDVRFPSNAYLTCQGGALSPSQALAIAEWAAAEVSYGSTFNNYEAARGDPERTSRQMKRYGALVHPPAAEARRLYQQTNAHYTKDGQRVAHLEYANYRVSPKW